MNTSLVSKEEYGGIVAQANSLAQSEIVPRAFRGKPHDIIAVALIGREVGLSPMMSMQYINVIEGKPSMSAESMVALARGKGHTIKQVSLDDNGAKVYGKRSDTGDEMTFEFTRADAQAAGLLGKKVWQSFFRSMAWARAVSQLCRMLFPDVIMGISYVPEELGASVDSDGAVVQAETMQDKAPLQVQAQEQAKPQVEAGSMDVEDIPFGEDEVVEAEIAEEVVIDDGWAEPEPMPEPTLDEQHALDAEKLFPKGWPMGRCRGGNPLSQAEVDNNSLEYLASKSDVNDAKWGDKNRQTKEWCEAELARRDTLAEAEAIGSGEPTPNKIQQRYDDRKQKVIEMGSALRQTGEEFALAFAKYIKDNHMNLDKLSAGDFKKLEVKNDQIKTDGVPF